MGATFSSGYRIIDPVTGLLMQWGTVDNIPSHGPVNVTFPVTFASAVYYANAVPTAFDGNNDNGGIILTALSNSGCSFSNSGDNVLGHPMYMAIGI
jgi:hypothetical protein